MTVMSHSERMAGVFIWIVTIVVFQGDAGQKGAGQAGPEGSGGDSGEFSS